jgi:hypothetical protein
MAKSRLPEEPLVGCPDIALQVHEHWNMMSQISDSQNNFARKKCQIYGCDNLGIPKMEQRCERTSVENLPCHCHAKVGVTVSTLIMSKISRLWRSLGHILRSPVSMVGPQIPSCAHCVNLGFFSEWGYIDLELKN